MLAYLTHLVTIGVFDKIRLSFLLVEYTWTDDVDEAYGWVFSSIRKVVWEWPRWMSTGSESTRPS